MSRTVEELDAFWIPLLRKVKAKSNNRLHVALGFNEMSGADFHQIPTLFPYVEAIGIMSGDSETAAQANSIFRKAAAELHDPRWSKVVAVYKDDPRYDGYFELLFFQE
jgi:hypothetical protein